MQRVASGGGDARVHPSRRQREDGVLGAVERVDDVVRRARVLGVVLEHLERQGPRFHLLADVRIVVAVIGEERERVLERDLVVVRIVAVHRRRGREPGRVRVARQVLLVVGARHPEEGAFLGRERLLSADARERRAPVRGVPVVPDGLVVGHRVAPRGHGALGVGGEGRGEADVGLIVEERMEGQHPFGEVALALRGPGDGEVEPPEPDAFRRWRRAAADGDGAGGCG